MDQAKLRHTWHVNENARYWRFYKWLYQFDDKTPNFCTLFWGLAFSWLVLLWWAAIAGGYRIAAVARNVFRSKAAKKACPPTKKAAAQVGTTVAEGAGWLANKISAFVGTIKFFLGGHSAVRELVYVLLGLVGLAGLAIGFYFWVTLSLISLEFVGIDIGWLLALVGVSFGAVYLGDRYSAGFRKFGDWVVRVLTPIGHGFAAFGRFVAFFYIAVKTRTCPRIEVVSSDSAS